MIHFKKLYTSFGSQLHLRVRILSMNGFFKLLTAYDRDLSFSTNRNFSSLSGRARKCFSEFRRKGPRSYNSATHSHTGHACLRVTNTFIDLTINLKRLSLDFSFRVVEWTVLKTLHLENGTTRRWLKLSTHIHNLTRRWFAVQRPKGWNQQPIGGVVQYLHCILQNQIIIRYCVFWVHNILSSLGVLSHAAHDTDVQRLRSFPFECISCNF